MVLLLRPLIPRTGPHRKGVCPFFLLGGFSPLRSNTLSAVARTLGASPMQVALSWLLARAQNILLIPGTSSLDHLRENLAAADLALPDEVIEQLNAIGG